MGRRGGKGFEGVVSGTTRSVLPTSSMSRARLGLLISQRIGGRVTGHLFAQHSYFGLQSHNTLTISPACPAGVPLHGAAPLHCPAIFPSPVVTPPPCALGPAPGASPAPSSSPVFLSEARTAIELLVPLELLEEGLRSLFRLLMPRPGMLRSVSLSAGSELLEPLDKRVQALLRFRVTLLRLRRYLLGLSRRLRLS